jgi:hypothetical protein
MSGINLGHIDFGLLSFRFSGAIQTCDPTMYVFVFVSLQRMTS